MNTHRTPASHRNTAAFTPMRVVHTTLPRAMPRELLNTHLTSFERNYLDWYHGDPLKRSLSKAHEHSINHRTALLASEHCGCFNCLAVFPPSHITRWLRDAHDGTALCPHCGIDAVLGDTSGYPLTPEFLGRMQKAWFG